MSDSLQHEVVRAVEALRLSLTSDKATKRKVCVACVVL